MRSRSPRSCRLDERLRGVERLAGDVLPRTGLAAPHDARLRQHLRPERRGLGSFRGRVAERDDERDLERFTVMLRRCVLPWVQEAT